MVGVIATPDCQLEILPKIEGAGESSVDNATLRHRLIHMLAVALDIRIDAGAELLGLRSLAGSATRSWNC